MTKYTGILDAENDDALVIHLKWDKTMQKPPFRRETQC